MEGLSSVNIINTLNNDKSAKNLSCKDTVILLKHSQLDSGANKSTTNNLDYFKAYLEIDPVSLLGVSSNVTVSFTHRGTCNLVTKNCTVTPMLMFYSPLASHIVMTPDDAVATSDNFST